MYLCKIDTNQRSFVETRVQYHMDQQTRLQLGQTTVLRRRFVRTTLDHIAARVELDILEMDSLVQVYHVSSASYVWKLLGHLGPGLNIKIKEIANKFFVKSYKVVKCCTLTFSG